MAELAGTVVTLVGLSAEGVKIVATLKVLVNEFKTSFPQAQTTLRDLDGTVNILEQFRENMEFESEAQPRFYKRFYVDMDHLLSDCADIFKDLRAALDHAFPGILEAPETDTFTVRKRDKFSWLFNRIEVVSAKKRLDDVRRRLHTLCLVVIQVRIIENTKESQARERQARERAKENARRAKRRQAHVLQLNEYKIKALRVQSLLAQESAGIDVETYSLSENEVGHLNADFEMSAHRHNVDEKSIIGEGTKPWHGKARDLDVLNERHLGRSDAAFKPSSKPTEFQTTGGAALGLTSVTQAEVQPLEVESKGFNDDTKHASSHGESSFVRYKQKGSVPENDVVGNNTDENDRPENDRPENDQKKPMAADLLDPTLESVTKSKAVQVRKRPKTYGLSAKLKGRIRHHASDGTVREELSTDRRAVQIGYIIHVLREDDELEAEVHELALSEEELHRLVGDFRKKQKLVMEQCARLHPTILNTINGEIRDRAVPRSRARTESALAMEAAWSLAMLRILPKRARGLDIRKVQFVLQLNERPTVPDQDAAMSVDHKDDDDDQHDGQTKQIEMQIPNDTDAAMVRPEPVNVYSVNAYPVSVIKLTDAVGRRFSFPWELCKTWPQIFGLIKQAFENVEGFSKPVIDGQFDLVNSSGEIILPTLWEKLAQPGWSVSMFMWPVAEEDTQQINVVHDLPPSPPPKTRKKHTKPRAGGRFTFGGSSKLRSRRDYGSDDEIDPPYEGAGKSRSSNLRSTKTHSAVNDSKAKVQRPYHRKQSSDSSGSGYATVVPTKSRSKARALQRSSRHDQNLAMEKRHPDKLRKEDEFNKRAIEAAKNANQISLQVTKEPGRQEHEGRSHFDSSMHQQKAGDDTALSVSEASVGALRVDHDIAELLRTYADVDVESLHGVEEVHSGWRCLITQPDDTAVASDKSEEEAEQEPGRPSSENGQHNSSSRRGSLERLPPTMTGQNEITSIDGNGDEDEQARSEFLEG